ncbi:MAG: Protein hfq [Firmicutes bacterium]|nr:Protein hfq [Bacillota bacterium]
MTTKVINLQDSFLNQIRKENNLPVIIYLINGFQLRGVVKGFDNFTVIIENDGKQQLVYKHAISTITPLKHYAPAFHEKKDDKENLVCPKP